MKQKVFLADEKMMALIRQLAFDEKISESELIRRAINEHFQKLETEK